MYQPNDQEISWVLSLNEVVNAARLVCLFDGADRISIEALRDALYKFGVENERAKNGNLN